MRKTITDSEFETISWHDNIIYTCSNVHYFRSEDDIDSWCRRHAIPRGEALTLEKAWELARGWYGNYLSENWQPRDAAQTNALLSGCGFRSEFWRLPVK